MLGEEVDAIGGMRLRIWPNAVRLLGERMKRIRTDFLLSDTGVQYWVYLGWMCHLMTLPF
jgi:hypothetical protein